MAMASGRAFSTLGRRLMDMGQIVGDKRRERQAQEEREREREIAEQRYETSLRLTPGVYEAPPSTTEFVDAPKLNASMPENPFDRPVRDVGLRMPEPTQLDMPNFDVMPVTRQNTLQEGHTRLNDRLAFNPNFQRDQAIAEEERRRDAIMAALGDNPNREAIATGATLGVDLSYRPFTRDDMMRDNREVAMTPRWMPPEPDQLVTGGDGFQWSWNPVTNRAERTPIPAQTTGGGGNRGFASEAADWKTIWERVDGDYGRLPLHQKQQVLRAIMDGEEPMYLSDAEQEAADAAQGGSSSDGGGFGIGSGLGFALRSMVPTPWTTGSPSASADTSAFNLSASPTTATESPMGEKQLITRDQADFLRTVRGMSDEEIALRYTVQ